MRRFGAVLLVLALVGLGTFTYLRLFTGDPEWVIGGGALRGELVNEPILDWSFVPKQLHNLDVESRASWPPYSTSPWFMVHEGTIYVLLPSLFGDGLLKRIERDPDLSVRIEGRIYPVRAFLVQDETHLAILLAPFLRRQMAVEIGGPTRRVSSGLDATVAIYRLESR